MRSATVCAKNDMVCERSLLQAGFRFLRLWKVGRAGGGCSGLLGCWGRCCWEQKKILVGILLAA